MQLTNRGHPSKTSSDVQYIVWCIVMRIMNNTDSRRESKEEALTLTTQKASSHGWNATREGDDALELLPRRVGVLPCAVAPDRGTPQRAERGGPAALPPHLRGDGGPGLRVGLRLREARRRRRRG
jgi:hypothetical protein